MDLLAYYISASYTQTICRGSHSLPVKKKKKRKKKTPRIIMGEKEGTNIIYASGLLKDADTVESI